MTEQRIYVACLASYNNGVLHGRWIDATTDIDEMQAQIAAMLRESRFPNVTVPDWQKTAIDAGWSRNEHNGYFVAPVGNEPRMAEYESWQELCEENDLEPVMVPSAEEWAIHDHEGLGDIGEYASLETIATRVALAELAEDRDIPLSVLLEFVNDYCPDGDADDIESEIDDRYEGSFTSAGDWAAERAEDIGFEVPDWIGCHVDWEGVARDWLMDYSQFDANGQTYLFRV